ncbi:hypothetical protein XELAEV_18042991mg [Xenopus laevis]|uniref:Uncharacterized protein n=1 Tax=Xenopus laevis TaxID=8355 RepID=A0A974H6V5_XENLA|nr:hypothetical protein XELAEV_18042991mg [Xenopus laevis]
MKLRGGAGREQFWGGATCGREPAGTSGAGRQICAGEEQPEGNAEQLSHRSREGQGERRDLPRVGIGLLGSG